MLGWVKISTIGPGHRNMSDFHALPGDVWRWVASRKEWDQSGHDRTLSQHCQGAPSLFHFRFSPTLVRFGQRDSVF